jgi:signal transduction histidine kinase
MRRLRLALWPAGLVFGVAAEWIGRPPLTPLDAATGFALVFLGLVAWSGRPDSRAGVILCAAGFAWFLGALWAPAVFVHRGALAQLLISYPSGRLSSRVQWVGVGAAYAYAVAAAVGWNDYQTIVFALGVAALAAQRSVGATGPERRSRQISLAAAMAFGLVLLVGTVARLIGVGSNVVVLLVYDLTLCLIAVGLTAGLLRKRWAQAAVAGLVVDLGRPAAGGVLQDRLARVLGDPTVVVGYWLPGQGRYVDGTGRPLALPAAGAGRAVTPVEENGRRVAVLIHDPAVLDDPALLAAAGAAARLAVANARLQAEVSARVGEVEASRRRIVEASDEQRRRFERDLRDGAEQRLVQVTELLGDGDGPLAEVRVALDAARAELREFARGMHPATLTEFGLGASVRQLAERSPVRVEIEVGGPVTRFPAAIEAAAYFVCAESLTNIAKHAEASRVHVGITPENGRLRIVVADDGIGGADPSRSSGLRGLRDRVEALGGSLIVESPVGGGTRVLAELPCG